MTKRLAVTLLGGALLLMILASVVSAGEYTFGFAAPWLLDEGQIAIQAGFVEAAMADGHKAVTTNANGDVKKQMDQIDTLLQMKVDAVVTVPTDSAVLSEAVKKANSMGIPFICIDRSTTEGDLFVTVQSDNYMAGKQAGEYMVNLLVKKYGEPKGTVVELQGDLSQNVAQLRGGGFNDVMKEYPNIKVLSRPTQWLASRAAEVITEILAARPDIDGIYWHSDCMGGAVVSVIEAAGKLVPVGDPARIFLVGIDGAPSVLNLIREGKVEATMAQPLLDFGAIAYRLFMEAKAGKTVAEGPYVEAGALWSPAEIVSTATGPMLNLATSPVDKSNVDDKRLWGNF